MDEGAVQQSVALESVINADDSDRRHGLTACNFLGIVILQKHEVNMTEGRLRHIIIPTHSPDFHSCECWLPSRGSVTQQAGGCKILQARSADPEFAPSHGSIIWNGYFDIRWVTSDNSILPLQFDSCKILM